MCGITGWVSYDGGLAGRRHLLDRMTATMTGRGPDAGGTWSDRHAALGHRRLSIIDLAGGAQPMTAATDGGTVALTYSGEVYNFRQLRGELRARGHRFTTASDTEVVLRGYLEWGEAVVDHLTGMYAFGVWDGRTERLLLVRDRLGIKPLYYQSTPGGVVFGSEPKALLAHPDIRPVVDLDGLREIMLGVKTPGAAVWKGMRELPPAHIAVLDRSGLRERSYWELRATDHTDGREASAAHLGALLEGSVREQLVADVPLCTLLSGGLDSSAITGLAARELAYGGDALRSFSVDFVGHSDHFVPDEHNVSPDTAYARAVADHVGSRHTNLVLDPAALADLDVRRACVAARDLPIGRGDMDHSLLLLFRAVREHSTVALSGEGADEMFGGYWWFHDPALRASAGFPWLTAATGGVRQERTFLRAECQRALDIPEFAEQRYREAVAATPVLDGEGAERRRARELLYLHLTRSLGGMLDRKDRLSMAAGLEVRVPFCDHRIVEYAYNIPWPLHVFDGREKSVLRAATGHVVPEVVRRRTKSPYPMTRDVRYIEALQRQALDVLAERDAAVFALVDRQAAVRAASTPWGACANAPGQRLVLEKLLDLHVWLDLYKPELVMC
ncbi:asparagine synthase (glutamine-hydrolyzing) [Streptomyces sp. TLI_146]|uniref:asparagine synthase (glutamine-hydrolyzing) n=1 Tax=Streptomyces sp. TLI_146 TaxID=1938858 RepID=UPI000C701A0C|nr:asparagine synthase (glutamine-hydrolyzing) [Streptomyces sp. TLI_146]PKV83028.1 asparagine synthase (glutamine-hydrolysing) [Streptomyces sp. TLI_146]